jgi:hypothetical protein
LIRRKTDASTSVGYSKLPLLVRATVTTLHTASHREMIRVRQVQMLAICEKVKAQPNSRGPTKFLSTNATATVLICNRSSEGFWKVRLGPAEREPTFEISGLVEQKLRGLFFCRRVIIAVDNGSA